MKKPDLSAITSQLRKLSPFLGSISSEALERIVARANVQYFQDGEPISHPGDQINELHIVLAGRIRSSSIAQDGREHVLGFIEPGNFSGLFGVLDGLPNPHSHIAHGELTVLAFSTSETKALINEEPSFRDAILNLLCFRLRGSLMLLDEYVLSPPMERLARRLTALAEHYGVATCDGLRLELAMSQDELGAMIGLSRQSTNKHLRTLESREVLRFRYGQIQIMDLNTLKGIASGEATP